MTKPSIKTLTVRNLTTFLVALSVVIIGIVALNFRYLSKEIVEDKALSIAELVKAGLTSHMKAGIMDKRGYFLKELQSLDEVAFLTVVRSPEMIEQFGPGISTLRESFAEVDQAFSRKEAVFTLDEWRKDPKIYAAIPYLASKQGELNCLGCHNVAEGTVLGVVCVELNLASYRFMALKFMAGISLIAIIFGLLIIVNSSKTIQHVITEPLESLIDKAQGAYFERRPVNYDDFDSFEFECVAKEINIFNDNIIHNQEIIKKKNEELLSLNFEIEDTLKETIFTMGVIEESRSKETSNHTIRVRKYCRLLAEKLGMSDKKIDILAAASPLHDIGKLGIPDSILLKPEKLTKGEYETMKSHPEIGFAMLRHSERDILKAAAIIAYEHHEKWDGSGYPRGVKGKDIHIYGRIVALADVFDALSTKRVYKESWSIDDTKSVIKGERGQHFDPHLVDIFVENIDGFVKIRDEYHT